MTGDLVFLLFTQPLGASLKTYYCLAESVHIRPLQVKLEGRSILRDCGPSVLLNREHLVHSFEFCRFERQLLIEPDNDMGQPAGCFVDSVYASRTGQQHQIG